MNQIPTLDELISHYSQKGLFAHPEMVRSIASKIKDIPVEIPTRVLGRNIALLLVWPLIEAYRIAEESIGQDISGKEKETFNDLHAKFEVVKSGSDFQFVLDKVMDDGSCDVTYLNPFTLNSTEFLGTILSGLEGCDAMERHIKQTNMSRMKIVHDAKMAGSIYLAGKDKTIPFLPPVNYSFLQRAFLCVDKDGGPVIFIDSIEGGDAAYKKLDHWRGAHEDEYRTFANRLHHVYLAVAAAMYMADELDINIIVPRDYELVELSQNLGLRERRIFDKEQKYRKAGLHSSKKFSGVYTHSLYRGTEINHSGNQLRHRALETSPFRKTSEMVARLEDIGLKIIEMNRERTRKIYPRTDQRLDAMNAMHALIENYPLTPQHRIEEARRLVNEVYLAVARFGRKATVNYRG